MESDRSNNTFSDGTRNNVQRARPLHGRTSGPTRRSTKGQWTAEEDEILRLAVQRFKGKNWKKIAECFKDRTDVQCLHRWQKVLNPDLVKGPWSKEEDEIIIELVNKYGPKKWSTIAQHLPGRIGKQCRERWHNHLNPNINKEAWTQEEELALIRAHQIYGNKWAELTKFLPGRTDNSIKNHWNSSVKKKLDMYLASGLLSQFQGLPLVSHPNQSAVSSSSKAQQSSEDDSVVRGGAVELEDASECSQSTNNTVAAAQPREESRATEESSSLPRPEDYRPTFQEANFAIPEVPCELNDKFLEHDFSLDWGALAGKDWQINPNDIPDMSMLDLGQESSGMFLTSFSNHEEVQFPQEPSIGLDTENANLIAHPDCGMVYAEANCPPENVISNIDGPSDTLLHQTSKFQNPEDRTFASESCFAQSSDMFGNSFTQQSLSFPTQLSQMDASHMFSVNPNHYSYSHENPNTDDGFIYSKDSDCSPCKDNNSKEAKESPKLVPANDFVLASNNDPHPQCCSSPEERDNKTNEQKDSSGALFYEPPRFPSLDVPFFSCDLIHQDMHQEYSPLGIRQLMISSSMTPFKLWDSPCRDDNNSPDAVLKSAAKTFTGTPSILKKRHRDLVSPLSEKRGEKKLESSCLGQESFSNLSNDFSRLEVMFDECVDKKGKENENPSCGQLENEGNERIAISESRMSAKEFNGSDCSSKITEKTAAPDVGTNAEGNDAMEMAQEISGILVEHDMNDMLFFSPDRFGIKSSKALGNLSRPLDAVPKHHGAILSSSESCFSVICSPRLRSKKDGLNSLILTTSLQSLSPSQKAVESSGKCVTSENNGIFLETPFKRSIESPSAWKSPWFINSFGPGPRVDTDITIEDIGYFLSPGERSYDAIGLMKQLGEQTAGALADAQKVLGDETPETIMKQKCSIIQDEEKENFMTERRTLDFSECGTPGKETGKLSSSSTAFSSPSSYLLKSCR